MKVVQFNVPVLNGESVIVNEDILPFFYDYVHRHKEMQITLILRGEGTLVVGDYAQPFKQGDLYIIGDNQPHIFKSDDRYYSDVNLANVHAIHIFFEHENTLSTLINLPEMEFVKRFLENASQGLQVPDEYTPEATKIFLKISRATGLKRLLLFIKLVQYLTRDVKEYKHLSTGISKFPDSEPEDVRMKKIYQYTAEHYAENISLERIASIVHITPHAFCKYFKQHTRKTYKVFLNEVRINEACKRIMNGDFDCISSVAYATGFNSPTNFNKVFKKTTGLSPSEYLKEFRNRYVKVVKMMKQPA